MTTFTAYHATEAEFVAALVKAYKQGLRFDVSITGNGATYQPAVLAWQPKSTDQTLHRFNAMAEGTHYARRIGANEKAYAMLDAAKESAK